jgi:hypothetical protein
MYGSGLRGDYANNLGEVVWPHQPEKRRTICLPSYNTAAKLDTRILLK